MRTFINILAILLVIASFVGFIVMSLIIKALVYGYVYEAVIG